MSTERAARAAKQGRTVKNINRIEEEEAEFRAKKTQHFTLVVAAALLLWKIRFFTCVAILKKDFSGDLEDCFRDL